MNIPRPDHPTWMRLHPCSNGSRSCALRSSYGDYLWAYTRTDKVVSDHRFYHSNAPRRQEWQGLWVCQDCETQIIFEALLEGS